jgi:hypothetical protein
VRVTFGKRTREHWGTKYNGVFISGWHLDDAKRADWSWDEACDWFEREQPESYLALQSGLIDEVTVELPEWSPLEKFERLYLR